LWWEVSLAVNVLTSVSGVWLDWAIRIASVMTPCRALLTWLKLWFNSSKLVSWRARASLTSLWNSVLVLLCVSMN
jgi:hypothetical protein